jgi:lysyl-tRNA synthetase, class II
LSIKHNPEFTMMEAYQAYTDYKGMMDLTERLISAACQAVHGTTMITYQDKTIDLTPPFSRLTMHEAIRMYAGVDFDQVADAAAAARWLKSTIWKVFARACCAATS